MINRRLQDRPVTSLPITNSILRKAWAKTARPSSLTTVIRVQRFRLVLEVGPGRGGNEHPTHLIDARYGIRNDGSIFLQDADIRLNTAHPGLRPIRDRLPFREMEANGVWIPFSGYLVSSRVPEGLRAWRAFIEQGVSATYWHRDLLRHRPRTGGADQPSSGRAASLGSDISTLHPALRSAGDYRFEPGGAGALSQDDQLLDPPCREFLHWNARAAHTGAKQRLIS